MPLNKKSITAQRSWHYGRLSSDEDKELNSMNNQMDILRDYSKLHKFINIGESFDDNISGMHFNRPGLDELYNAAAAGKIDVVLVKDLSRLGRHKALTALFMDDLKRFNVRVFSVTENIDTFNENDDLVIGMKQLVNDLYAKDIARKVRYGYLQKQKAGIVITPPFGYFKDKNTKEITIVEEAADAVRKIYELYISGFGDKKTSLYLSNMGYPSPAYMQKKLLNKEAGNKRTKMSREYQWSDRTVKRILTDESYIGTLICHKTVTNKIDNIRKAVPLEEQFRHENFYPPIIDKHLWETAQEVRNHRKGNHVQGSKGNKPIHRYAGILRCGECDATFCSKHRKLKTSDYIEYVCNTYHRMGTSFCSQHRIREQELDKIIFKELRKLKFVAQDNWNSVQHIIEQYVNNQQQNDILIKQLEQQSEDLRNENKVLTRQLARSGMQEIQDELAQQMIENKKHIEDLQVKMDKLKNSEHVYENKLKTLKVSIDMLDDIVQNGIIRSQTIRDIVEKITIYQQNDGQLDIRVTLKAPLLMQQKLQDIFVLYDEGQVKSDSADIIEKLGEVIEEIA